MNREPWLDRAVEFVERAAAMFLAAITALTFVSVFLRYLFRAPLPDDFDLSRLLLGVCVFWGIACACHRGEHIQVDLLWRALPRRGRLAMDALATAVTLGFMALFAWMMLARVAATRAAGMTTFELQLPLWPFYGVAWLGLGLAVVLLAAYLRRLFRGDA